MSAGVMAQATVPAAAAEVARAIVLSAIMLGVVLRFLFVVRADFPPGDGALFYSMARDLQANEYRLPDFTSYNGGDIPFAYPPLQLYLAAILDDLTPLGLLDVMRFAPLVTNLLTIGAVYLLARTMLRSVLEAEAATGVFALSPYSFFWTLMGGGITRSWGMLFGVLTIWQAYQMLIRPGRWRIASVSLLGACTILSHPTMGAAAAISCGVLFGFLARSREGVTRSVLAATATVVLTSPWWLTIAVRHGPLALLGATDSGLHPLFGVALFLFGYHQSGRTSIAESSLFIVGVLVALSQRRYLLPSWLLILALLSPRAVEWTGSPVLAMLAGIGVAAMLNSSLRPCPRLVAGAGFALLVGMGIVTYTGLSSMPGISRDTRDSLTWVRANTPEISRFLVIAPNPAAQPDFDWFPALSGRRSLTAYQGYEWVRQFVNRDAINDELQSCATRDGDCVEEWSTRESIDYDYIYISKMAGQVPLDRSLRHDPRFALLHESSNTAVFALARR